MGGGTVVFGACIIIIRNRIPVMDMSSVQFKCSLCCNSHNKSQTTYRGKKRVLGLTCLRKATYSTTAPQHRDTNSEVPAISVFQDHLELVVQVSNSLNFNLMTHMHI